MMADQTSPVTFVLIARIPEAGIADFRAYEDAVLPLLSEFSGRLERRLRNPDGTVEVHVVSFASDSDFQNYRSDPRRMAQTRLLEKSSAKLELLPMADVSLVAHHADLRIDREGRDRSSTGKGKDI